MSIKGLTGIIAVLAAMALSAPASAGIDVGGIDNGKGGSIKGVVKFEGKKIDQKPVVMSADPFCAKAHPADKPALSERWVWGKNDTLQNVFVQVVKGLEGKSFDKPEKPHVIDQVGCMYTPHVSGCVVGQEVQIKNSDSTLHNVHGLPKVNEEWNVGQPVKGMVHKISFPKTEEGIFIKCDVHAWMSSYLHVVEHPFFAVTQEEGTFEIKGLPPGEYEIKFWHEFRRFAPDKETVKVTVEEGKAAEVTVTYSPTPSN